MRYLWAAALAILSICRAVAETPRPTSKISPRIEKLGASAYVLVFHDVALVAAGRDALRERGFDLIEHPDLRATDLLIAGPRGRLEEIAAWEGVANVLPASHDLLVRRRVHACPGAIDAARDIAAAYAVGPRGWATEGGVVALKLAFETLPLGVDPNAARGEIERALEEWQKYANLTVSFDGVPGASRTIAVRFAHGAHGDSYPFDGRGGNLAHTFYPAPLNAEPLAGDMHFDVDEGWGIGVGVDLFTVALHEAGHALGLAHSDQPGAVMYPYYRQAYGLTSDDIAGIEALYGARGATVPSQPPVAPPTPPVTPPKSAPPPSTPTGTTSSTDRTAPAIRITTPTATSMTTTAAAVSLAGTAFDDTGAVAVRWSTSSGDAGDAAGTASWTVTAPVYPGVTVITVRAYDAAGNSGWRSITVTRR